MIATKSIWAWIKVGVSGLLLAFICLGIAIWLFLSNNEGKYSGFDFFKVFVDKPWVTLLLFSSFLFSFLYIMMANKMAMQKLIRMVWENKLGGFILPKVQSYIFQFSSKQPNWLVGITSSEFSHMFIDAISRDETLNKVQSMVMNYGFRGMNLKKNEFQQPEADLSFIIVEKIEEKISGSANSSFNFFFVLVIMQLLILVLALLFT